MIAEADDAKKDDAAKGDDKEGLIKKLKKILADAVNNFAADKAGDLLDELFLGNFKDAVLDVFKNKKANEMSEEDLATAMEDLKKSSQYKRGKDNAELDSRKDTNTNTEIDPSSTKVWALWMSKDKEANIGKTINDIVVEFQKSAQNMEKQQKDLAASLKKMKIKISDEEFSQFGPMLQKAVESGDAKEVQKKLDELRKQIKESYQIRLNKYINKAVLLEGTVILTEAKKQELMLDVLLESKEFQDAVIQQMINEGFLDKIKGIGKALGKGLKKFGSDALQSMTKGVIGPMLSLGGLAMSIATGGWAAAAILRLTYIIEKQGKKLRNGFEKAYTAYANSKGAIAKMDFQIKVDEKSTQNYSMRFYEKDMVWRVLNTSDQLKHPGKDFAKQIVDGEQGKKFREALKKHWDPLFSENKGGKIDFKEILSQTKNVDIPSKYIDLYSNFAENYDQIKANCIDSPKIDTRTQSLKKEN